ncbi:MAG: CPBP family intramembrane metalloprotease [Ruminococcaceae bacterium]|nr:CPBP family intramembrane metalloprotease [Oscillospiraceae bacterium]
MISRKKITIISIFVILYCIIMALVDGVLKADYFVKSAIKLVLFLGFPAIYSAFDKDVSIRPLFIPKKKGMLLSALLAVGVFTVILGGYLLLRGVFDFSAITGQLTENIGVTKENFVFVSLYISFVNSLLEEFFFRGFAFLTLKRIASSRFAYVFSAAAFAIYHAAMMIGWFSAGLFLLVMAGLFVGGLIFDFLNDKSGNIYPSWLVHMFANFAINIVGFILFGIIKI